MGKHYMVLTAIGPDRPGIVKEVAALIHRAGGNLEDSRMAVLAQEFALIALFSGTPEAVEQVRRESPALEKALQLSVTLRPTAAREPARELRRLRLDAKGEDRPGIVHRVGEVLAGLKVNVVSLESRLDPAPFSGTPLFVLRAELELPEATRAELERKLEEVCEQQQLAYSLEPLEAARASR